MGYILLLFGIVAAVISFIGADFGFGVIFLVMALCGAAWELVRPSGSSSSDTGLPLIFQ